MRAAEPAPQTPTRDRVSVVRWFVFYGLLLAGACAALAVLIAREPWTWADWRQQTARTFAATDETLKLLGFGIYLSLCCTFLPLPTGWIVAAVAPRQAAVGGGVWDTTLLVAAVGAAGSTIANLNDYHLFTLILRHRGVAKVRHTRLYDRAARWFGRSPLFILVVFNIIPIPVDVIRMLATTYRYPRRPFAAANFIGRFVRYGIIAFVTYWWNLGWIAVVALLGIAVLLGVSRVGSMAVRKLRARKANAGATGLSDG